MATMPGFADDVIGRRRVVEIEVTAPKKGFSPFGQVRWRNPILGSQELAGLGLQIGRRRVLIPLRARLAGSF